MQFYILQEVHLSCRPRSNELLTAIQRNWLKRNKQTHSPKLGKCILLPEHAHKADKRGALTQKSCLRSCCWRQSCSRKAQVHAKQGVGRGWELRASSAWQSLLWLNAHKKMDTIYLIRFQEPLKHMSELRFIFLSAPNAVFTQLLQN